MKIRKMATPTEILQTDLKDSVPSYPVPYLPAFFIFLVAIGIGIFLEYTSNIADIGNNWPELRCKPHIMPFAGLFGYDVNENFQFCLQQIIAGSIKSTTAPFAEGIGGFTGVLSNLMGSANSIRVTLATLTGGIIKIIGEFKSRMSALMGRVKLSASRMKAMMYRIYGTMFAVMYMGMSAQTGIANFGDTFIFKFIDTFCFAPGTKVIMKNGTETQIQSLELGQVLYGGSVVEAIIECPIPDGPLYEIYGIRVSGGHKIWSYDLQSFIPVIEHPDARLSYKETSSLWTLVTSNREIPVKGSNGKDYVRFADWEEMPPTIQSAIDWNRIAQIILNGIVTLEDPTHIYEGPCIEGDITVYKYQGGLIPISDARIGDWIYDVRGWTKIIGKCSRMANGGFGTIGQRITDGNWILQEDNTWKHPTGTLGSDKWQGYQLITSSGSFMININLQQYVVRDFTEVGCENLLESYRQEDSVR